MSTLVSRYNPIWAALKKDGVCVITAPPVLHPRIIKAVAKRKYRDLAFHLEMSEAGKSAKLSHKISGSVITFTLNKSIGIGDL